MLPVGSMDEGSLCTSGYVDIIAWTILCFSVCTDSPDYCYYSMTLFVCSCFIFSQYYIYLLLISVIIINYVKT